MVSILNVFNRTKKQTKLFSTDIGSYTMMLTALALIYKGFLGVTIYFSRAQNAIPCYKMFYSVCILFLFWYRIE